MAATLQTVVDRITLDYLNRTDFNAATIRAVQAAIRHYERQRWPWNQTTQTLASVPSVATISIPSDFLVLDMLEVNFQSATYELLPKSFAQIRRINANPGAAGLPCYFTQRGIEFHIAPFPDSAYPILCHYLKQLPKLTANAMTGTNDWLSAAEDVIVYHATKLMWANVLRNTDEALKYAQLETAAVVALASYRDQNTSIRLQPKSL
jgi:hypothetical protein